MSEWGLNRCGTCNHTHHQHILRPGRCVQFIRNPESEYLAYMPCPCKGWREV